MTICSARVKKTEYSIKIKLEFETPCSPIVFQGLGYPRSPAQIPGPGFSENWNTRTLYILMKVGMFIITVD